jgi:hypothetical protein
MGRIWEIAHMPERIYLVSSPALTTKIIRIVPNHPDFLATVPYTIKEQIAYFRDYIVNYDSSTPEALADLINDLPLKNEVISAAYAQVLHKNYNFPTVCCKCPFNACVHLNV